MAEHTHDVIVIDGWLGALEVLRQALAGLPGDRVAAFKVADLRWQRA